MRDVNMATSLICSEVQSRVSSVLNRDVKQYGKKYMFDCNEETCWNSDQGECQWVILEFPQSVKVSEIKIQFQGGFSAKTCILEGGAKEGAFTVISQFYPEDDNSLQSKLQYANLHYTSVPVVEAAPVTLGAVFFLMPILSVRHFPIQEASAVDKVKIMFENSADFFGRIIVYSLDVLGENDHFLKFLS